MKKIFVALLILLGAASACSLQTEQEEIEHASFLPISEVQRIGLYSLGDDMQILSDDEMSEVLEALKLVEYSGEGSLSYLDYSGFLARMFCLELKNGETIDFAASAPFYIFDLQGYRADYMSCDSISKLYWQLLDEYFGCENQTQQNDGNSGVIKDKR